MPGWKAKAKQLVFAVYRKMTGLLRVKKDIILMGSNLGRNYSGNPRAIYEELVRRGLDRRYRIVWVFDHPEQNRLPGRCRKVKSNRLGHLYYLCVAGTWVFDCRQHPSFIKKPEVRYIQTWHGTPLKKLALDMESLNMAGQTDIGQYRAEFARDASRWDYLLSQNPFSTEIFRRAFAFDKVMLEIGYPRNDVLFRDNNPEQIRAVRKKLGLPSDRKVLLYAPTWRDNQYIQPGSYRFASPLDFGMLREALGEEYVCIVKYHYLIAEKLDWSAYEGFVYSFDNSYDIAELYLAADMLVTDYSSVMFDYSILKRPMLFYVYDLEEYRDCLRGFYFDFIEEAPGPLSVTTEELIRNIREYDPAAYREKYRAFTEKFNPLDDGHAAEKVADLICEGEK